MGRGKVTGYSLVLLGLWASPTFLRASEARKAPAMNLATDGAKPEMTWPLADLLKVPAVAEAHSAQQVEGVRSLLMEGVPYRGQATQLFAYYAAPKGQPPAGGWPAVVIAHGGGGTAYAKYIQMWNDRGYAAIALDFYGKVPAPGVPPTEREALNKDFPDPYGAAPQAPEEEWSYHVVSAIIRAHSLLRSFPEVNPEKTGLVGTSWGGIHACIAAGLDPRFKVVVAIYGCGFLSGGDKSISFHRRFSGGLPWWDPSGYLPKTKAAFFWIAGTNDEDFSPDMRQKSIDLVPTTKATSLVVGLGHSDDGQAYPVVDRMLGSVLGKEAPFPALSRPQIDGSQVHARYETERRPAKAELCYTTDPGDRASRNWQTLPAKLERDSVSASLPEAATAFFFNLYEKAGEAAPQGDVWPVSSAYVERPVPNAVK